MAKLSKISCFMSTVPNDMIAHTHAQAAVMESMLAEIQFWRTRAGIDHAPLAGRKRKSSEATCDKLAKAEKEVERLKSELKDARESRKELQNKLDAKRKELEIVAVSGSELNSRMRSKEEELDEKTRKLVEREKVLAEKEKEATRLGEKYRAKRRALTQVDEARVEIIKICNENPDVKQRLGRMVTRWKSESVARTAGTSMRRPMSILRNSPNLPPPSCTMKEHVQYDMPPPEPRRLIYDDL
eukprot:TRINITY_DN16360_c0_g1_i2.p1 TRINITY_DN16360_c0_g1~~TRINITY_DN16360_c0_g1_i2.p1  ORF type:complete len:253 (+),score=106.24 TRINITY_DN16360_c0_g1_i2:34-759(+)